MTRLARAVAVLVAATCGAYTLIYLYRWEWHRAILAGVFPVRAGVHTVVELQLHGELAQSAPARMAASLWHVCEGALRRDLPEPVVTVLGGARVQLALPVDIGTHALRRLHGCLEDAAFDRVQAGVIVRMVSAPG